MALDRVVRLVVRLIRETAGVTELARSDWRVARLSSDTADVMRLARRTNSSRTKSEPAPLA